MGVKIDVPKIRLKYKLEVNVQLVQLKTRYQWTYHWT